MATASQLNLSLRELTELVSRVTTPCMSTTLPQCAGRLVGDLRDSLRDGEGDPAAALVRLFVTTPHADLDEAGKAFVRETFPDAKPEPDTKCLTLVGTVGDDEAWCTIEGSKGHQAIPLMSAQAVSEIPMVTRLFSQLGLKIEEVLAPDAGVAEELDERSFDVFHVETAVGSDYIPAQDSFVVPAGVRSVIGFGTLMPTGHLAVILVFSKATISAETATLFQPLALGLRLAILPFLEEKVFDAEDRSFGELERLRATQAAQSQLLSVFRNTVVDQSTKLDGTLDELKASNEDLQSTLDELNDARAKLEAARKGLATRFALDKLREVSTYKVAFIVGTLINFYGHFIVPFFRGHDAIWDRFVGELRDHPLLAICSILIAYLFPVAVQVHSAVTTRIRTHAAEMRATFPDMKPDPVFRVAPDGKIIDAGARTMVLLKKHGLATVQQMLGVALWKEILSLTREQKKLPRETAVHVDALDASFLVTHSPGADGAVNIYLTEIEPRGTA